MLFHAPTCKLVSKSYARLLYNDFLASPEAPQFDSVPQDLRELDYERSLSDRNIEKTFMGLSKKKFEERVKPSLLAPTQCGNMYTASVYSGLVSLLSNIDSDILQGKRVALFSYGSGLASSLFSLIVKGSTKELADKLNLKERLEARRVVEPQVYDYMCELRHQAHGKKNFIPQGSAETISKGAYYCLKVDELFRRQYQRKE
ncbi:unnamed protein product [Tuber melanosporum]|uniref:(Perigord truffle) hypothetical protein n=1 Tax=Tuber melanosporum (strain Mel28) TaxID=656061 RepID=D5GFX5_TUBMM|nr:uncharacterized protein GSTUM_00001924001 [Tuber melanosporum]CAZ83418.1 unnamed protein product [Tuber melanosporum]